MSSATEGMAWLTCRCWMRENTSESMRWWLRGNTSESMRWWLRGKDNDDGTTNMRILWRNTHIKRMRSWGWGGVKLENLWNKKAPKSTLLADKTRGLITTKQTKPRPVIRGDETVLPGPESQQTLSLHRFGVSHMVESGPCEEGR